MDEPHPISGLTPREVNTVRKSWRIVERQQQGAGMTIFMQFFAKYPHNYKYFVSYFNTTDIESLPQNEKFKRHALKVVKAIGGCVKHLDNVELVLDHLVEIGKKHTKVHIDPTAYTELRQILLSTLAQVCRLDSNGVTAWEKVCDVVFSTILNASKPQKQTTPLIKK